MRGGLLLLPLLLLGCAEYSERASCSMGLVLDDEGRCVAPPVPDGGVSIADCADLCARVPDWTADQVSCLQRNLSVAGPPPAECATLSTEAECDACVIAAGADDAACSLAASCL